MGFWSGFRFEATQSTTGKKLKRSLSIPFKHTVNTIEYWELNVYI